jgi:SAM-dependent methyltransferase
MIFFDALKCLQCHQSHFEAAEAQITCKNCHTVYKKSKGTYLFFQYTTQDITDSLDQFKYLLKKFQKLYAFLIFLIAPVLYTENWELRRFLKKCFKKNPKALILDLGSGNRNIHNDVIKVDGFHYEAVQVCADIMKLPFKDNSVDALINTRVIEHLSDPHLLVAEMYRVLKPGGYVFCTIPFIQGYHASPKDFSRLTHQGIDYLFKKFHQEQIYCQGGPTSALLWVVQEWLAMLLSLGIMPLYRILHLFFLATTWPLKFLDLALKHHPAAKFISSELTYIGKKP